MKYPQEFRDRFYSRFLIGSGCWEWSGARIGPGYGTIGLLGKSVYAHRTSYEMFNGQIPGGHFVCHRCDNPSCVRPGHLFAGTQLDNIRDMDSKGRRVSRGAPGERHPRSKLTVEDVKEIRARRKTGEPLASIGRAFGVHLATVHCIATRKAWRHV